MRWTSFFLLIVAVAAQADEPKKADKGFQRPPTEFECRWAEGKITIDGKADEPAWKNAQVIDRFYVPWLGDKARAAKTKTSAKLLWDRDYLYFFAEMEDTDLYADVKEHDGMTWFNDVFELFFKPAEDKPGYYEFQVNAAGTIMDMFIPRRGSGGYQRYIKDGDFHIEAKVVLKGTLNKWTDKDQGWSVEGRIPWTDFMKSGGRPDVNERWRFALCRYDYSVDFEGPELSTCAPLKASNFHAHEDYALLKFVGQNIEKLNPAFAKRTPLTTSTVVGSPDPPPPYRVERAYPNLKVNFPIDVKHIPGSDQLFYITQERSYGDTVIRRMKDDPKTADSELVLELKGTAYDLTFHPQFAKNGYIYVGWNGKGKDDKKYCRVTRWTILPKAPWTIDKKSEQVIIEWQSDGHNGAAVTFGLDGMLYVTSGDGTSDSDTNVAGQRMDLLLSKLMRIDVDHPDKDKMYSVPKDNPFVGREGIRPETWAYGFRNPWRIHCDKKTGHIWVGQNGQDLWEQVFFIRKGDNYGWSVYEGSHPFYLERKLGPTPHVHPTFEHHHSEARSLTGGVVYYGTKYPDLVGAYIYGDYSTGRIWAGKHDGQKVLWHKEIAQTRLQITGFGTDANGELLICDHVGDGKGGFYHLVPSPKEIAPSKFPKKLSDSGLFTSVKGHQMQPALIPYSVNAELWSDGAHKERWLAMPGADSKIDYRANRGWGFPDQTVIVKSFALEMEEGKPESRKWIETRFLTKQGNEWYGYSYLWNDEQTDGTLVESKGMDREYAIKAKDGTRSQKWHYPSRSECMVCHSRAANWVLGLSEVQMNKEHNYGSCTENQLEVFARLGLISKFNYGQQVKDVLKYELERKGKSDKEITEAIASATATRLQRVPVTSSSLMAFSSERFRKLVNPYDKSADLTLRARSYLHANCAHCHVEAGGGNALFDVEFTIKADKMKLFDVKPVHHTFKLNEARLVVPGDPNRSVLLHRVSNREQGHMPPLASAIVDKEAVAMLREWIRTMPPFKVDLTPERAKDALVEMMRQVPVPLIYPAGAPELRSEKVKESEGKTRIGVFEVDVAKKTFSLEYTQGCLFSYKGAFEWRDGAWAAKVISGVIAKPME